MLSRSICRAFRLANLQSVTIASLLHAQPYDPTGERLYTYLPADYCATEFELRRCIAANADEASLTWLRQHHGERQAERGLVPSRVVAASSASGALGQPCAHCCAFSAPRLQVCMQTDGGAVTSHGLALRGRTAALSPGGRVLCQASAPPSSVGGTATWGSEDGLLMELEDEIQREILQYLAPVDASALGQTCRHWRSLCTEQLHAQEEPSSPGPRAMCLSLWARAAEASPPAGDGDGESMASALHWLRVLRHVSLLCAVGNGGTVEEGMGRFQLSNC